MNTLRDLVYRYRFIVFSVLTLALAALVYGSGLDPQTAPFALVVLPAIAALATAAVAGRGEVRHLMHRIVRWRVSPWLYVAAIGVGVGANLLIVVLAVATGTPLSDAFSDMSAAALVVPLVVVLPALFEEFGWRGFGIPALNRMPLIVSALLVGIPFTLIHLPLHMPGHLYADLPMWPTIVSTMSLAVLTAWIFAAARGSSLLAGLMHAAANGAVPLTWGIDTVRVWEMRGVAYLAVAVIVLILARRTFMAPLVEDASPAQPVLEPSVAAAA
jgi:membrane protease YdiL (CAAX protease family)